MMSDVLKEKPLVSRVEVISEKGRDYVNTQCSNVRVAIQDDGRTIKIFLQNTVKSSVE